MAEEGEPSERCLGLGCMGYAERRMHWGACINSISCNHPFTIGAILMVLSRTSSRSPQRANTDSRIPTAHQPSPLASGTNAREPSPATHPSVRAPHQPTITEEAQAHVAKSVSTSRSGAARAGRSNGNAVASSSNGATKSRSRMVGDWQLLKTLGAGSMGKVKLAQNVFTKEKVCRPYIMRNGQADE